MAKNHDPTETKEQRKARKAQEKAEKAKHVETKEEEPPHEVPSPDQKRFVVCLKHGDKYGPEYVNTLHRMVKRNLTLDYEFVCFTEDERGLDQDIKVLPLPHLPVNGWWYKPLFFDPSLPLKGTLLYLDLDIIIFNNIDHLFEHKPNKFLILRDFNRCRIKNYQKMNSSVMRLNTGQNRYIYQEFIKDPRNSSRKFHGDQDWIFWQLKGKPNDFDFWPDEWIQSYKWEMRGNPQMTRRSGGGRNFAQPGEPTIHPKTSIAVFHGDPNPHDCIDPWCKKNWY